MTGALVAVVGPSGAGKDAVIGYAAERLAGCPDVLFPRRVITRPAGAGEEHDPADEDEFERRARAGGFALSWRAHGLHYGIPVRVAERVREGDVAIVNLSRALLPELHEAFCRVRVARVSVSESVRRERILARGREDRAAAAARLARADPAPGVAVDAEICNDGPLESAGEKLLALVASVR